MRFHSRALAAGVSLVVASGVAQAQVIAGTVLLPDSVTPARGVLVEVSAGARTPTRALTDAAGNFRMRLAASASVRVRVLRPGFRPAIEPPFALSVGETKSVRLVLGHTPIILAAVTVRESPVCGARADAAAWQLWEQARTVLQTTMLTERDTSLRVRTVEYQGEATPSGSLIIRDSTVRLVPVDDEFHPAHYDSLFSRGYIRRGADSVLTYYAPNANVLADERFVTGNCFRVTPRSASPPGLIGVDFEPARAASHTGIVGTFWLDSASFLLRQIDFGYINPPLNHRVVGTGGFVSFAKLETGHWIMAEWTMRMANTVMITEPRPRFRQANGSYVVERNGLLPLAGYRVRWGRGLWARNQLIVSVHQGDRRLFHEPLGDSIARRAVPRRTH